MQIKEVEKIKELFYNNFKDHDQLTEFNKLITEIECTQLYELMFDYIKDNGMTEFMQELEETWNQTNQDYWENGKTIQKERIINYINDALALEEDRK